MTSHPLKAPFRCAALVSIACLGSLGLISCITAQTTPATPAALVGPAAPTVAAVPAVPAAAAAPRLEALRAPSQIAAVNGVVDQRLDALFGVANIVTPAGTAQVTVRAYAPPRAANALPTAAIPGPTFVFHPGDLLRIRFENQLNATANPALNAFDNNIQQVGATTGSFDDIRDHAAHEISIPNDSNVTNLHVHGLHVDPKQDNVTLLIVPKDVSPGTLSPELQRFVPNINQWWTRAYQYKIPADHIPGTYWYHSHKHGSTSTQVENGMAGTLLMLPANKNDDIVPAISGTPFDRIMMIQEIVNFGSSPNVGGTLAPRLNAGRPGVIPGTGGGRGGGGGGGGGRGGGGGPGSGGGGGRGRNALLGRVLTNNNVAPPTNAAGSIVTMNGQYQPTTKLPAGQIERWRFIFAGANHTAAGSLWVGKYVLPPRASLPAAFVTAVQGMTTIAQAQAYTTGSSPTLFPSAAAVPPPTAQVMPGDVLLAALDGIPIRAPVTITPSAPTLGGAGNRFDVFVRPSSAATSSGPYYIYQNYPPPSQADLAAAYPDLFGPTVDQSVPGLAAARWTAVTTGASPPPAPNQPNGPPPIVPPVTDVNKVTLPNLFRTDTYALGSNYQGFTQTWQNVDADGNPVTSSSGITPQVTLPVAPLLRAKLMSPTSQGIEIAEPSNDPASAFPNGGRWQPMPDAADGAPPTAAVLMVVDTSGAAVPPVTPDPLAPATFAARVSSLSPAGTATALKRVNKSGQLVPGIPSYVAPITGPVDGHQVPVFDRGQFTFDYTDKVTGSVQQFRQFWISGRQFDIDDAVGNPASTALIQKPLVNVEPSLGRYNPAAAANTWTHQVAPAVADGQPKIVVTNPGYFRPIKTYTVGSSNAYNYDYSSYTPPTAASLSGLEAPPSLPKSRSSEEWILINNSDLYHPFHIHISPFFVEEVGQLNYAPGAGGAAGTWSLYKTVWNGVTGKSESVPKSSNPPQFGWVVGAWWDVIMMPPHGYVRFKTWINVPDQVPTNPEDPLSDLAVIDNANTYGSWVFHCHILRHEDRGMMSMVSTVPNPVVLGPTWYDNQSGASAVQYNVTDVHGGLKVQSAAAGSVPFAGTFNEGLGNPFVSQPYSGAMNFPGGAAAFCATESAQLLVFSSGLQWSTAANAPAYSPPPATPAYVDLTGTWTDDTDTKNQATITQTKTTNSSGATIGSLTIKPIVAPPVASVWWTGASGSWNAGGVAPTPAPALAFGGMVTFARTQNGQTVRNQVLSMCVTSDGKKIVFSNGITWTKN